HPRSLFGSGGCAAVPGRSCTPRPAGTRCARRPSSALRGPWSPVTWTTSPRAGWSRRTAACWRTSTAESCGSGCRPGPAARPRDPRPARPLACGLLALPVELGGAEQAVADGKQDGHHAVVVRDPAVQVLDRDGLAVPLGGVGDPVVPQRVVEGDRTAGAEQAQGLLVVVGVLQLVAVAEDQI